jgi:hypothetical protein
LNLQSLPSKEVVYSLIQLCDPDFARV